MEQPKRDRYTNSTQREFGNSGFNGNSSPRENATSVFASLGYNSEWIKNGATPQMVKYAEDAGKFMANNKLTNSKIRSIYGEIKRIQMGEFEKEKSSFYLLKPKVAYALGRDDSNEGLRLFKLIFDKCSADVVDQKTYHNFCNFIEAILAYHKAYGGRD